MVAHWEQGPRRLVGHLGAAVEVPLPVLQTKLIKLLIISFIQKKH